MYILKNYLNGTFLPTFSRIFDILKPYSYFLYSQLLVK